MLMYVQHSLNGCGMVHLATLLLNFKVTLGSERERERERETPLSPPVMMTTLIIIPMRLFIIQASNSYLCILVRDV